MTAASAPHDRRSFEISHDPCMFTATLNMNSAGNWLVIYASTILDWTDAQFAPVLERLDRFCTRLVSKMTVADDRMMFQEATMYEMELYSACPGNTTDHSCCRIDALTPRMEEMQVAA